MDWTVCSMSRGQKHRYHRYQTCYTHDAQSYSRCDSILYWPTWVYHAVIANHRDILYCPNRQQSSGCDHLTDDQDSWTIRFHGCEEILKNYHLLLVFNATEIVKENWGALLMTVNKWKTNNSNEYNTSLRKPSTYNDFSAEFRKAEVECASTDSSVTTTHFGPPPICSASWAYLCDPSRWMVDASQS